GAGGFQGPAGWGFDGTFRLRDLATGKNLGPAVPFQGVVSGLTVGPDQKTFVVVNDPQPEGGVAQVWDVSAEKPVARQLRGRVRLGVFRADGKALLTLGRSAGKWQARLWDLATGQPSDLPLQPPEDVLALALSPDGRTVLTGNGNKTASLWEAATGKLLGELHGHQNAVAAVALSPDGKTALTGGWD